MEAFKRILSIALLAIILVIMIGNNSYMTTNASTNYRQGSPVRVGLFTRDLNDDYIVLLRKNFEDIQKNNPGEVSFSFIMPILINQHKTQILKMHFTRVLILYY